MSAQESLYISNKDELIKVITWIGVIIFWLTFWLPQGLFLAGEATSLGVFLPAMEVVMPVAVLGLLLIFAGYLTTKISDHEYRKSFMRGIKTAGFFVLALIFLSLFSRNIPVSLALVGVWGMALLVIPMTHILLIDSVYKKILLAFSLGIGFTMYRLFPHLTISLDILAVGGLFGLMVISQKIPRNIRSKESIIDRVLQLVCLYIIFQSNNILFPLLALGVIIFSQKIFTFRRGAISPDISGGVFFLIFLVIRLFTSGIYFFSLPQIVPHFWSNIQSVLFGVGAGQFLPALQQNSDYIVSSSDLIIPNSSFLLVLFEKGVLGLFAIALLFVFSQYMYPKRSILYLGVLVSLFLFSSVFLGTENGIILFIFLLFLNTEKELT